MKSLLLYTSLLFTLQSCYNAKSTNDSEAESISNYSNNKDSDTLFVNENSAVYVSADSSKIEKLKKKIGEDNFYVGADDAMYYTSNARSFIDSVKLRSFIVKNEKYIKFTNHTNVNTIIKIDSLEAIQSIYFFDIKKNPKLINIADIEIEYKEYFR